MEDMTVAVCRSSMVLWKDNFNLISYVYGNSTAIASFQTASIYDKIFYRIAAKIQSYDLIIITVKSK